MRTRNWSTYLIFCLMVAVGGALVVLYFSTRPDDTPIATATSSAVAASAAVPVESVASATPEPIITSPTETIYTVESGDTLGAIALMYDVTVDGILQANGLDDPNVLHIGQELIIPAPAAEVAEAAAPAAVESAPLPTPFPTPSPIGPPLVEIARVLGSGNLDAETVTVRNRGGAASLAEWTLADEEGNVYTFPGVTLFTDGEVVLHTANGDSTPRDLYWGRIQTAWDGGELLQLRDETGALVDSYIIP